MKKQLQYIILCLFLGSNFFTISLSAQVKIGDTTPPSDFSILEIDTKNKKGGFRIPQLSDAECNNLKSYLTQQISEAEKKAANGLIVYNKDRKNLFYWDGTDWANSESLNALYAENGLKLINDPNEGSVNLDGGLKLGGNLTENTTIDTKDKTLSFPLTGKDPHFSISNNITQENTLHISNNKVGIGGTAAPEKILDINNQTLGIETLRIENSNEALNNILASNSDGNALWQPLKALASVEPGGIDKDVVFGSDIYTKGSVEEVNITSSGNNRLKLTTGKWLIVAKINTKAAWYDRRPTNSHYLVYLSLKSTLDSNPTASTKYQFKTMTSALPSQKLIETKDGKKYFYAMPQLFYYTEVSAKEEYYHLFARSSRPHQISDAFGDYFFALRIDGMGTDISTVANRTCISTPNPITIKTGADVPDNITGQVSIHIQDGQTFIEKSNSVGSGLGVYLEALDNYALEKGTTTTINYKVTGTLQNRVKTGTYTIPIQVGSAKMQGDRCAVTLIVPTEGILNCGELLQINNKSEKERQALLYRGRGKSMNISSSIELEMTSGSVEITKGMILAQKNGITMTSEIEDTFYANNPFKIPVKVSGVMSNDAVDSFKLFPNLNIEGITSTCTEGLTMHVVIGEIEKIDAVESPSNSSIYKIVPIKVLLDNDSDETFKLFSGTTLGYGGNFKVSYVGDDITLHRGVNDINVLVAGSRSSEDFPPVGTYTTRLDRLEEYGISSTDLTVNVINYGEFGIVAPIDDLIVSDEEINKEFSLPLNWNTHSVIIKNGDKLGSINKLGVLYEVTAIEDISLDSGATNVKCMLRISAPSKVGEVTIPLNKVKGVGSTNLTVKLNPKPEEETGE